MSEIYQSHVSHRVASYDVFLRGVVETDGETIDFL